MLREEAEKIAKDFLNEYNHSLWNGEGMIPAEFDYIHYYLYAIDDHYMMYLEYEEDSAIGWYYKCSVYRLDTDDAMYVLCGRAINSFTEIADTIMRLVDGYMEEQYERNAGEEKETA